MLKLSSVLTDGCILQRDKMIAVWGWTDGESVIAAELNGQTAYCISARSGNFSLRLPRMAAGGPYTLTVRNEKTSETVTVHDVLIGEVWLCSGQSNMQYGLCSVWGEFSKSYKSALAANRAPVCKQQLEDFDRELQEVPAANFRFFMVDLDATGAREETYDGKWLRMTDPDHGPCSAVGAWFGLKLLRELQVPVGLLFSAYGGSPVEAWTSLGALGVNPVTAPLLNDIDWTYSQRKFLYETSLPWYGDDPNALKPAEDPGNQGVDQGWASPEFDDDNWRKIFIPGSWKKQKLGGNGAAWFRLSLTIPDEWAGQDLIVNLGGIDKTDITYFNNTEIGRSGKALDDSLWDTPRHYQVPGNLVKAGRNMLAIRAYSHFQDGSLNGSVEQFYLENPAVPGSRIKLSGFWKAAMEYDAGDITPEGPALFARPGRRNHHTPAILFDTMLAPLLPYSLRGIIWYQGETNANNLADGAGYASKLETMLDDWRRHFCQPDLPLIQVELANYHAPEDYNDSNPWTILREEQQKATREMKGMYMVSAIDAGEEDDIHPEDKRTPGERLAACALNKVYDRFEVVPFGPVLSSYELRGNTAILHFDCADGLEIRPSDRFSFFVADVNRNFMPADEVTIQGHTVIVRSQSFDRLEAVRYAWSDNPACVLYNGAGYPASPFRTDNWAPTITF